MAVLYGGCVRAEVRDTLLFRGACSFTSPLAHRDVTGPPRLWQSLHSLLS